MNKRFIIFIGISFLIIYFSNYLLVSREENKEINVRHNIEKIQNIKQEKEINDEKNVCSKKDGIKNGLENDNIKLEINSFGSSIESIIIKKFDNGKMDLISDKNCSKLAFIDLKINDFDYNLGEINWNVGGVIENSLKYSLLKDKIYFEKYFILDRDKYSGKVELIIKNDRNEKISVKEMSFDFGLIRSNVPNKVENYKIDIFSAGKTYSFKNGKNDEKTSINLENGWIGIINQYFCQIFYSKTNEIDNILVEKYKNESMDAKLYFKDFFIEKGQEKKIDLSFYFGPQNYQILKNYDNKIYKAVNFGFFHYIALFILFILKFLYNFTNNYGFSIILLTLIIKGILWWPTQKSYTSMKNMQNIMNKMQPRLKTIKEIYKDNSQKLNEETMKLYKEYKINPMGGCLPLLLQMPIFFALYATLTNAVELKGASFIWLWKDLSQKDPTYILPIMMGISMFVQQKISATPAATPEAAAQQKMMLYLMPIMLTFFSFVWPSGLLLYWVTYNIASIIQQIFINRSN